MNSEADDLAQDLENKMWWEDYKDRVLDKDNEYHRQMNSWWRKRHRRLDWKYYTEETCQEFFALASQVLQEGDNEPTL